MFGSVRSLSLMRSRWAAVGAAVAVSLSSGGAVWLAHAAGESAPASFVSITPCRLFDTRPGSDTVGNRSAALNAGEVFDRQVWGSNGNCLIPSTATAIAYNLTVPDAGINGFMTIYPGDAARPGSSVINPVAGAGVKSNGGVVGLSATGSIKLFTSSGPLNALLDINGYFVAAAAGPRGATGSTGPTGPTGAPGPAGGLGPLSGTCSATGRWDLATCRNLNVVLPPGSTGPNVIASDGKHIFVTEGTSGTMSVIDPATGAILIQAPLLAGAVDPLGITFSDTRMFIANATSSSVTVYDLASATLVGVFPLAPAVGLPAVGPMGITYDGTNIWTANNGSNNVTRANATIGGGVNFELPAGATAPMGIVYDGTNIWTANNTSNSVTRINPSTGAGTNFALPGGATAPIGILFDGVNIWTVNNTSNNVTRINPTTGAGTNVALAAGASSPVDITFDGTNIWTADSGSNNVTRINSVTGAATNIALPAGATSPFGIVFDGTHIWTANNTSNNISRLVP